MGMFDSVWVNCPRCGEPIDFQSKSGDCSLTDYYLGDDIPELIMADVASQQEICPNCDSLVKVVKSPWTVVSKRPNPWPI